MTRHEKKLVKDRSRLDTRKYFFSQRVVNGWNSLPAEVINSTSVNSFKNAYDRYSTTAKIWTTEADQRPVHQPTSTSTSFTKWPSASASRRHSFLAISMGRTGLAVANPTYRLPGKGLLIVWCQQSHVIVAVQSQLFLQSI